MATLNSYVTVLRLIYLMFGICNFVNAKYEELKSCAGSDAEIDFGESEAKKPIFTEWFFTSAKTRIAKMLSTTDYDQDNKSRFFIDRNKLHLININSSDSGMYTRMVRDDSNGRELYTDEVNLTVLSPPSSLPSFHIEKKERSLIVRCEPPRYKGHPEVQVVLKDSKGKPQDSLTIVGSDNLYQCCIEGEATQCFREQSFCEWEETGECQQCFVVTFVSWLIMEFFIVVYFLIHFRCNRTIMNINFNKGKKRDMLLLQVVIGVVLSLTLILATTFLLCTDSKSCKIPAVVYIICGVGSALMMFIPNKILRPFCKDIEAENDMATRGAQESYTNTDVTGAQNGTTTTCARETNTNPDGTEKQNGTTTTSARETNTNSDGTEEQNGTTTTSALETNTNSDGTKKQNGTTTTSARETNTNSDGTEEQNGTTTTSALETNTNSDGTEKQNGTTTTSARETNTNSDGTEEQNGTTTTSALETNTNSDGTKAENVRATSPVQESITDPNVRGAKQSTTTTLARETNTNSYRTERENDEPSFNQTYIQSTGDSVNGYDNTDQGESIHLLHTRT